MIMGSGEGFADSVNRMIFEKGASTAPLEDFVKAYEQNNKLWWQILCGHHMNLFDAALERIRELELVILTTADQVMEAISQTEDLAALAEEEINRTEEAINERYPADYEEKGDLP